MMNHIFSDCPIQWRKNSHYALADLLQMQLKSVDLNFCGKISSFEPRARFFNSVSISSNFRAILRPDEFRLCGAFSHDMKFF